MLATKSAEIVNQKTRPAGILTEAARWKNRSSSRSERFPYLPSEENLKRSRDLSSVISARSPTVNPCLSNAQKPIRGPKMGKVGTHRWQDADRGKVRLVERASDIGSDAVSAAVQRQRYSSVVA